MVSHLASAWTWTKCSDPTGCAKILHSDESAETLNEYPHEWVTHLFPGFHITDLQVAKLDSAGSFHNDDGPAVVKFTGTKTWYQHGKLHRVDGPAIISHDGDTCWFFEGRKHREGGPADERQDGTQIWYKHGKIHHQHGPALISRKKKQKFKDGAPVTTFKKRVASLIVEFFIS